MTKLFTEEQIEEINKLYDNGWTLKRIGEKYDVSRYIITKYIINKRPSNPVISKTLTEEEIQDVLDLYLESNWDEIFRKYPVFEKKKSRIYDLASKRNVKKEKYYWTSNEDEILKNNYGILTIIEIKHLLNDNRTETSIMCRASFLGLTNSHHWSESELNILKTYYSEIQLMKL